MSPVVLAVSLSSSHSFSKTPRSSISLIAGLGIEGDAHAGKTVRHRYLAEKDSTRPNIRQVHLIQRELLDDLNAMGFSIAPGQLGENMTTRGVDLLALPTRTKLRIGSNALVELTALRNPCSQIEDFQKGLLSAVIDRDATGAVVRRAGVMGVVLRGGDVKPGHIIEIELPPEPHRRLEYVW